MIKGMTITPKFNVKQIIEPTLLGKGWFEFQNKAYELGGSLLKYIQTYINTNRKRRGGTGNLAKQVGSGGVHVKSGAGYISWGIGDVNILNAKAKEWYVVNYGKMITGQQYIPWHGGFGYGSFEGNRPVRGMTEGVQKWNPADGTGFGMYPKRAMRPMHYIQATRHKLNQELRKLLIKLRRGKL